MKRFLTDFLICPGCLPRERPLSSRIDAIHGEEILTASLECSHCGARYPIKEGAAFLLPESWRNPPRAAAGYESQAAAASYLWTHYGDLFSDPEANIAYKKWADLIGNQAGMGLNAGCAVGRFTFELSQKCDFAVGLDCSSAFVRSARQLMLSQELEFSLPLEGLLLERQKIVLPESWSANKVEFLVADAQALPFPKDLFSSVASLNLIDKIRQPLVHLQEVNRVARNREARLLFSDPFSWSSEVAREEDWLGGTSKGAYAGEGLANVLRLLQGQYGELEPGWKIEEQGRLWWKIRNHRNHFELIRSCYILASR